VARPERDAGLTGRITLLTDFGTSDGYVAAMRGVIASRLPGCIVDDASHEIPPGDVLAGAHALSNYWRRYPAGTVHVVVIDPGVGTTRLPMIVLADGRFGVGPDNGVLAPMLIHGARSFEIADPGIRLEPVSSTFHGRDVFAPAAAWLAGGGLPERAGPPIDNPVPQPASRAMREAGVATGEVVHVDRFGTLVTNLPAEWLNGPDGAGEHALVELAGHSVGTVRRTYGDVASGDIVALIGSGGTLEISVRDGSAAKRFGLGRGAQVRVSRPRGSTLSSRATSGRPR
jgi:hypothetical protein